MQRGNSLNGEVNSGRSPRPLPANRSPRQDSVHSARANKDGLVSDPHSISRHNSARGSGAATPRPFVHAADVNPIFSVEGAARSICVINDRVVWTAEANGTIAIRSTAKCVPLKTLKGHGGSPCNKLIHIVSQGVVWAGFQDGYLALYDAKTGELMKAVMAHQGGVLALVEVEGSVFSGGADRNLRQWNPANLDIHVERTLTGHRGAVRCFAVYEGPTGAVLFSGSDDGTVCAWDPYLPAASGSACIHTFTGHEGAVLSLAVVPHANQIWSGGEDCSLRVWDMKTLQPISVLCDSHSAPITSLMTVESRMWSGDQKGHIYLWDITTHELLEDVALRMSGDNSAISQGAVLTMQKVQPSSMYKIWTASSGGVLQCWNAETVPIVFDALPMAKMEALAVSRRASTPRNGGDAELRAYAMSLQDELGNTRRDCRLNYEKYRLEVQREMETQQLLEEENQRLRARIRALEEEGAKTPTSPAPRAVPDAAMQKVVRDLQRELDEVRRQLADAEQEVAHLRLGEEGSSEGYVTPSAGHEEESVTPVMEPFTRQDDLVKIGSRGAFTRYSSQASSAAVIPSLPAAAVQQPGGSRALPLSASMDAQLTESNVHRRFTGDNWGYLLQEKPHELRATYTAELCAALGTSPSQLKELDLRHGSLVTDSTLVHPTSISGEELQRRVDAYPFPAMMKLHAEALVEPKTGLDEAEDTIRDLEKQLQEAQAEEERLHRQIANPAPAPVTPLTKRQEEEVQRLKKEVDDLKDKLDAVNTPSPSGDADALRAQLDRLREALDNEKDTVEYLKGVVSAKEKELLAAQELLKKQEEDSAKPTTVSQRLPLQGGQDESAIVPEDVDDSRAPPQVDETVMRAEKPARSTVGGSAPRAMAFSEDRATPWATPSRRTTFSCIPMTDEEVKQFRDLKRRVEYELEPKIGRLQKDKERLMQQLADARTAARAASASKPATPLRSGSTAPGSDTAALQRQLQRAQTDLAAANTKLDAAKAEIAALKVQLKTASATPKESPEVAQLREDHEALQQYLEVRLKPKIAELKRARGELQVDVRNANDALEEAYEMLSNASEAAEAARVREDKLGEALKEVQKALEESQKETHQRGTSPIADCENGLNKSQRRNSPAITVLRRSQPGEADPALDEGALAAVRKPASEELAAQNLALSVRLADAESVIAELRNSLDSSSSQLTRQKEETKRLLNVIHGYESNTPKNLAVQDKK